MSGTYEHAGDLSTAPSLVESKDSSVSSEVPDNKGHVDYFLQALSSIYKSLVSPLEAVLGWCVGKCHLEISKIVSAVYSLLPLAPEYIKTLLNH